MLAPKLGAEYILHQTSYFPPDSRGDSCVWDYSELQILGSNSVRLMAASESPYKDEFSKAKLCYSYGNGDYLYASQTDSSYARHGGVIDGQVLALNDPAELLHFPLKLGERHHDQFSAKYKIGDIPFLRVGDISSEVIGAGILISEGDVLHQVKLVECKEYYTDVFELSGEATVIATDRSSFLFVADGLEEAKLSLIKQSQDGKDAVKYGVLYDSVEGQRMSAEELFSRAELRPQASARNSFLRMDCATAGILQIDILSWNAEQTLATERVSVESGLLEHEIELKSLDPGSYLIRLKLAGQQRYLPLRKL